VSKRWGSLQTNQGEQNNEPLYKEDGFGFRTWNIDYNKKQGKRFLFVGSFSMGYGIGVTVDNTFSTVFYKELKKMRSSTPFEVINANRGNLTLSSTFHSIKDVFFTKFRPDVVVIGSYRPPHGYPRNDGQLLEERVFGDKRKNIHDVKKAKRNMIVASKMEHSDLWNNLYMKNLLMAKLLTYLDIKMFETVCYFTKCENEEIDYTGYLYDLHEFLLKHDIPLLVVELVEKRNDQLLRNGDYQKNKIVNKYVKEACDELGIPFLSIPQLRPIWSYDWVAYHHYAAKSNQLIGNDIAKWVNDTLDNDFKLVAPSPIKSNINIKTSLVLHR